MLGINLTACDSKGFNAKDTSLGNILFELSFAYSICKKYNIVLNLWHINVFMDKLKQLNLNHHDTIYRNIIALNNGPVDKFMPNVILKEDNSHLFSDMFLQQILYHKNKNVLINDSYLQSLVYFDEYKEDIIQLFKPDDNSLSYIHAKYPAFKNNNRNISIHIRLNWGANVTYDSNFIRDSIAYLNTKDATKCNIFVLSDNIPKAKIILNSINHSNDFIYCENNCDYIDMWIISLCNYNIICHSTLGWWGAYLNENKNKIVIYPSDVLYLMNNVLRKRFNEQAFYENCYPKDWICLKSSSLNTNQRTHKLLTTL